MKKKTDRNSVKIVAALPVLIEDGNVLVGLITSRDTGRWIVPKGKLHKDEAGHKGAEREAREEAGVVGHASRKPIARIAIDATGAGHAPLYLLKVEKVLDDWPERGSRDRRWENAAAAAMMIDDPALITVLLTFAVP